MKSISILVVMLAVALAVPVCAAQSDYHVITVLDGGTIRGTVKWQGALPHLTPSEINKDLQICDPLGEKHRDLERLVVSPNGGVANTVVYLKNVTEGKAMDLPLERRFLNQKNCRYEPHILLVPLDAKLTMRSSDPILHTVHMSGSEDYNLPFTTQGQEISRPMTREGMVDLRCNAGHVWMNGELVVASNPYYAVTDAEGNFELTDVPAGRYEIQAWHEGWRVVGEVPMYDVMTQMRIKRPVFSDSITMNKSVAVSAGGTASVHFTLSEKVAQMAGAQ
ncbi:MAG TPA: hypothetical protein VL983_04215 [Terriglobales bacterium]|nr:hypothetical protein [Terriglobales bacterium]